MLLLPSRGRRNIVPARAPWLLASGAVFLPAGTGFLSLASPTVEYMWLEAALGEWLWPAGCHMPTGLGRDPQERFRNLFARVYFDMRWKLWKVGSVFAAVVSQNCSW